MTGLWQIAFSHPLGALIEKPSVGVLLAAGTTVPTDATVGYAPGCVFIHTDGTAGDVYYVNEGSYSSCDFNHTATTGDTLAALTVTALTVGTLADATGTLLSTMAEIDRKCDLSASLVSITADTTCTLTAHGDRTMLLNKAGTEVTCTLPAATGTGAKYTFVQQAVNTSKYHILALAGDVMCGNILANSSGDTQSCQPWISLAATANIRVTLNGTTQGGVSIGDEVWVKDIATDRWQVGGLITQSGMEVTPFATS